MSLPRMKIKTPVPFPATVAGTGGIKVSKSAGVWTIEPDFSALSAVLASAIADPTTKEIWLWDPVTDDYTVLTLAGLGDALFLLTSTSSVAIGTGSKSFTTQSGKDIGVGSWVVVTDDAAPATNWMSGQVTAYSGTTLTVNVAVVGGSGTLSAWTIRVSGAWGAKGDKGDKGDTGNATMASATQHGVMVASGADTATSTAAPTDGQLIVGQTGADPLPKTITGDVTISAAGAASASASILKRDATNTISKGYTLTPANLGTITTGTTTLDPSNGNYQYYTNNGAHTLAAPAADCAIDVRITNGASAGAVTFSGMTGYLNTPSMTTTNGHVFDVCIRRIAGATKYGINPHQ